MNPDYSPKYYKSSSYRLGRKRQIVNALLEELYELHFNYIEEALQQSDFAEAKQIINYIRGL